MQLDQLNPIALDQLPMGMDPNDAADWQENSLGIQRILGDFFDEPVIRVNRLVEPIRPRWAGEWVRREQQQGPMVYAIRDLLRWRHRGQEAGNTVSMSELHDCLIRQGMIPYCLSLIDSDALVQKGVAFYRRHIGDVKFFFFGGCVRAHGVIHVPFIYPHQNQVVKDWREINRNFSCGPDCFVPMFKAN